MEMAYLGAGLGAGITSIGVGIGIGLIGAAAMEGTARQPEATGEIRTSMLISAAFIEGVALFGQIICFILATK